MVLQQLVVLAVLVLTSFHLKAHCTDHQAATRPTLILTGFNGFARGEDGGEGGRGCMSTGDGSGLDVSMNWVRRP